MISRRNKTCHHEPPERTGKHSLAEFEALTQAGYEQLPERFRELSKDVVVQVVDWPQPEVLDHFKLDDRYGLLGLYHGVSLDKRSILDIPRGPDMVFLYRFPITSYAEARGLTLAAVVTNVLVHEIGHFFGLSDADMEAIESDTDT